MKCHYCDKRSDLRPYGPLGSMICFKCAMESPGRKSEAEYNFALQLNAIAGPAVIDGTEAGPYTRQSITRRPAQPSPKQSVKIAQ